MFNSWLHLLALTAYLGAVIALPVILLPSLAAMEKHEDRAQLLARGLKFYNPLQTGALGVLILSGAFRLTELKAAYRELFMEQIGLALAVKLALAFVLIILSVYQSMGVGHRFVRRYEGGEPVSAQELGSIVRRLKSSAWCVFALALVTLWAGLRLRM
jgi:uncharacterized membrane protein